VERSEDRCVIKVYGSAQTIEEKLNAGRERLYRAAEIKTVL
jgi:hypothetical protein